MLSIDEIPRILFNFFKEIPGTGFNSMTKVRGKILIVDNMYSLVHKDDLYAVIKGNPLLRFPDNMRNQEILDCDDFSLQLKAAITALNRQKMASGEGLQYPPAVGIVITQNHALNIVFAKWGNKKRAFLIDTMEKESSLISNKEKCAQMLKMLPIKFIYI